MLQEGCFLYSAIGQPVPFNDSIRNGRILLKYIIKFWFLSGPRDCLCSEQSACTANSENEVDTIFGVMEVNEIEFCPYIFWIIYILTLGGRLPSFMSDACRLYDIHLVWKKHKKERVSINI